MAKHFKSKRDSEQTRFLREKARRVRQRNIIVEIRKQKQGRECIRMKLFLSSMEIISHLHQSSKHKEKRVLHIVETAQVHVMKLDI
jgi:hypothetical protein